MTNSQSANQPIAVGDLVQVVRSCCEIAAAEELGLIRTVLEISVNDAGAYLQRRGCRCLHGRLQKIARIEPTGWHPVAWLKRISPLSELEGVKTQEDIREPA